jgi:LPS-assembly protein
MKNKTLIIKIFIYFFFVFFSNKVFSEDLIFNATKILTTDNENIIRATDGVNVVDPSGLIIDSDEIEFNKEKSLLVAKGNVVLLDKVNNITLKANEIFYDKLLNIINTKNFTIIEIDNTHIIETSDIIYDANLKKISSKYKTTFKDLLNNKILVSEFNYSILDKIFKAENADAIDKDENKYKIEKLRFNLLQDKLIGKDISVNFNNKLFNSLDNQPRLKGKAIFLDKDTTIIKKGIFTTCKKRDKCPPWQMTSSEIKHDKIKKTLNYKNAWLKVYDVPILYFPKFFHPDPTVKRQSGFLAPKFAQSNTIGNYLALPYYKVIRDNIDLTFTPRVYSDDKIILQTEYRHLTKNSNHVLDFSIKNKSPLELMEKKTSSQTHFFSNSFINLNLDYFDQSKIDLQVQQTSDDSYLKKYKVNSPLIDSTSSLHSKINFEAIKDYTEFSLKSEVYENLNEPESDRYEYILPSYSYSKLLYEDFFDGNFVFSSTGHNKLFDTNINEKIIINDFTYNSDDLISTNGLLSSYSILLKNFNADSKNSTIYKNETENDLQTLIKYEVKYPLKKSRDRFDSIFSPIISARYSPNKNKNIKNEDRFINYDNIFALNRIGKDEMVEGGQSITIGNEYKIYDKENENNELFSFNLATMFRDKKNFKLPSSSRLGEKTSDIVGGMKFKTNKFLDFSYDFSLDNNLEDINYNSIDTSISVNNFVTTFEFMEKSNILGSESYVSNNTILNFDDNNSLAFKTRKNKEKDLTEYYNLIYQYKNDCLVAGIEYKKDYYQDVNIEPEEQVLFSITIMPFTKIKTPEVDK